MKLREAMHCACAAPSVFPYVSKRTMSEAMNASPNDFERRINLPGRSEVSLAGTTAFRRLCYEALLAGNMMASLTDPFTCFEVYSNDKDHSCLFLLLIMNNGAAIHL